MNLTAIKEIARERLAGKASHGWKEIGNKFYHGERVATLAGELKSRIFGDASPDDIQTVAAWFHDIRNGEEHHAKRGAETTRELLNGLCEPVELDEICEIIRVHDDRHGDRTQFTTRMKLQQDADLLDHFGVYDVWSAFIYAVPHNQTLDDSMRFLKYERPKEHEGYIKLLNYELSRDIYREKAAFLSEFAERFEKEAGGHIYRL